MKITDRNVVRLAVVQHLRAAYGIKIKHWNKSKGNNKMLSHHSGKIFGVPLDSLPQCTVAEYGTIPCFLVDACTRLMEDIHTEGLFRKSGSVVRLKALRAKLEQGEECVSTALPCDVAGLLKQFFRELPDPVLPTELQEALLKAQQLPTTEERTSALQLLSCMLPDRNSHMLRYFFTFLKDVSQRCDENKMDSGNLSLIFAPNLLQSENSEKMTSSTERRLKLQAAIVHFFIENPVDFGVVPSFILERVPTMLGCEAGVTSPLPQQAEDREMDSGVKKRQRRSLGDMVNGALHKLKSNRTPTITAQSDGHGTPVIMTPSSKRKLPHEPGHSHGFSNKKRRSIKKNLGLELLPNSFFSTSSTPGSGLGLDSSPSFCLDSSQSTSAGKPKRPCATSAQRKSRRRSSKHVSRVESGRAGCFSPKVSKKETVRRSLRLRFSLGRSSRDPNVIPQSLHETKGSEAIGWRLATQESSSSFLFKDPPFSPAVLRSKNASKRSKHMSKSEDNLLTPQCDAAGQRTSWNAASPVVARAFSGNSFSDTPSGTCFKNSYCSEPTLVSNKPSIVVSVPKGLCCTSSAESLDEGGEDALTGPTLLQIKRAFAESGSDLRSLIEDQSITFGKQIEMQARQTGTSDNGEQENNQNSPSQAPKTSTVDEQNAMLSELEMTPLTPLHIDSVLFEFGTLASPLFKEESAVQAADGVIDDVKKVVHRRLCEVLDVSSPTVPYRMQPQVTELNSPARLDTPLATQEEDAVRPPQSEAQLKNQEGSTAATESRRLRVADHIQRFNTLTLSSPKTKIRSPLKFQRTPVRQSVRRINSLQGKSASAQAPESPVVKSVSLESGLSGAGLWSHCANGRAHRLVCDTGAKLPPKAAPRKPAIVRQEIICGALDDVTNKVQPKTRSETAKSDVASCPARPEKSIVQEVSEKERRLFRGSPKNPFGQGRLLSAMKPIDF